MKFLGLAARTRQPGGADVPRPRSACPTLGRPGLPHGAARHAGCHRPKDQCRHGCRPETAPCATASDQGPSRSARHRRHGLVHKDEEGAGADVIKSANVTRVGGSPDIRYNDPFAT